MEAADVLGPKILDAVSLTIYTQQANYATKTQQTNYAIKSNYYVYETQW